MGSDRTTEPDAVLHQLHPLHRSWFVVGRTSQQRVAELEGQDEGVSPDEVDVLRLVPHVPPAGKPSPW